MPRRLTDAQCDQFSLWFGKFLDAMPEITVDMASDQLLYRDRETGRVTGHVIRDGYGGDVRRYLEDSFGNFVNEHVARDG